MEAILPIFVFCGWHLVVLALGAAIGYYRPWRWRIVRPETYDQAAQPGHNARYEYEDDDDVFTRARVRQ
jgi:hypothetical protein